MELSTRAFAASFSMYLCSCARQRKVFHPKTTEALQKKNEEVLPGKRVFEKARKLRPFSFLFVRRLEPSDVTS